MACPVELFAPTTHDFCVACRTLMREEVNVCVVSQVVTQAEFKILKNSNEETVGPELRKNFSRPDFIAFLQHSIYLRSSSCLDLTRRAAHC